MERGGGFVGIHSATDTEEDWPDYADIIGAFFANHPPGTSSATMMVEVPDHPATAHLDATWERVDEWYNFDRNPRVSSTVLLNLDESTYSGGTMGSDHPIAWTRKVGQGRVFYTAGGHTSEAYSEPSFVEHLSGGLSLALDR